MRRAAVTGAVLLFLTSLAQAQTSPEPKAEAPAMSSAEVRELLDAAKATAKATRENVDYSRVMPDLLYQILAKLDKIEDKLDKIETELNQGKAAPKKGR